MAALQYVDVPRYAALILRRTLPELELEEGLITRAHEWLDPFPDSMAKWSERKHKWTFPLYDKDGKPLPPAGLTFGYGETLKDMKRYLGSAWQYVGFDEQTTFEEVQFRYMFSRMRRKKGMTVPLRMRGASNPGEIGHEWVKSRYIDDDDPDNRIFISAKLTDNPYLDQESYALSLAELDPITRRQIMRGDWTAKHGGSLFDRTWFTMQSVVTVGCRRVRYWDLAGTERSEKKKRKKANDPAWTAGALIAKSREPKFYIEDMRRKMGRPLAMERFVLQTAVEDGKSVPIWIEQEPGQAGVAQMERYAKILAGYTFHPDRKTVDKELRAAPVSAQVEAGNVVVLVGPWNAAFYDEIEAFPGPGKKDQVDAMSGGFAKLTSGKEGMMDHILSEIEQMEREAAAVATRT